MLSEDPFNGFSNCRFKIVGDGPLSARYKTVRPKRIELQCKATVDVGGDMT
jgi:hypothetical protein